MNHATWTVAILEAILVFLILYKIFSARRGKQLYIRKIPGLSAIDEAVGRATEMGRPMMFSPGLAGLGLPTLQALSILKHITGIAAKYRTRIIVPTADSVVYTIAEEISKDAYNSQGVPEQFNAEDIRFLSDDQFAYASGCVGILNREKVASNFMFGTFFAESLILAETGHQVGAVQIAGTPSITQIPFFITSADYTIIGDEFYAASAYLSREPTLLGSLVGQDYAKAVLALVIALGIGLATFLGPKHMLLKKVFDASAPFPPGVPADAGRYTNDPRVTFEWIKSIDDLSGVERYIVQVGAAPGKKDVYSGSVGNVLTKTITGSDGKTYYCRVQTRDHAGKLSAWSDPSDGITVDTSAPTPGSLSIPAYANRGPITISYRGAADSASGSGLSDVSLWYRKGPGGAWAKWPSSLKSPDGSFEFTPTGDGTYYFAVIARDKASNVSGTASGNGDGSTIYDTTAPGATIRPALGQGGRTGASPIGFTVTFSEPISGFTASDVRIGGTAGATTAVVTGHGARYTVSASGMTRSGTLTIAIPAGSVCDAAGNLNAASGVGSVRFEPTLENMDSPSDDGL